MTRALKLVSTAPAVDPRAYVTINPDARRSIDALAGMVRQISTTASGSFTTEAKAQAARTLLEEVERLAKTARGQL